jgi:hypothetical protein
MEEDERRNGLSIRGLRKSRRKSLSSYRRIEAARFNVRWVQAMREHYPYKRAAKLKKLVKEWTQAKEKRVRG